MPHAQSGHSETIGVGFVGAGRIADLQCIGWIEHRHGRIAAVCDPNDETRQRRAAQWGATPYPDLESLLADESIDAVEILTPHYLHVDQAIASLQAGKHVSLQKPPAVSLEDYDRLFDEVVKARDKFGVQFRVFENFMWYPPHVLARKMTDEGEIGDVLSVRILTASGRQGAGEGWFLSPESSAWRLNPSLAGYGWATFDHGFHCFQMGRFFEVIASLGPEVRSKYYVSDDRMEIRGSKGVIWTNQCQGRLLEQAPVANCGASTQYPITYSCRYDPGGKHLTRPPSSTRKPRRYFAGFYSVLARIAEKGEIGHARRRLLADSSGRLLELGAGTGENFKHYPPMVTFAVLTEPDEAMLGHLRSRFRRKTSGPQHSIVRAAAEHLPFLDESFDTVVATLTLCSVDDVPAVLSEVLRVLVPGGRLLVFEHQLSPDKRVAAWQRRLDRPWGFFAGGCHLDRPTEDLIERAGFEAQDVESLNLKITLPVVKHHVFGSYRKPSAG